MPFFRIFQHLLPRSRAWNLLVDRTLRKFFSGLAQKPSEVRTYVDQVYEDLHPETTRELAAWEKQFGIPQAATEQDRRDAISAAWKAQGGQDKSYIESVLAESGFDVTLHEWWKVHRYLSFDGVDDQLVVGDIAEFDFERTDSFSVSFWLRGESGDNGSLVRKSNFIDLAEDGRGWSFGILGGGGQLNLRMDHDDFANGIALRSGASSYLDGSWHHVVWTYDGSSAASGFSLYVDGVDVSSGLIVDDDSLSDTIQNDQPLTFGGPYHSFVSTTFRWFGGDLDQVAIWNTELSGAEALEVYASGKIVDYTDLSTEPSLIGYWPVSGVSFPTLPDATDAGNDATMVDMAASSIVEDPGDTPGVIDYVPHDPRDYASGVPVGSNQCGDPDVQCRAQTDGPFRCNRFASEQPLYLVNKTLNANAPPPIPGDSSYWPYFLYVGGDVFPSVATIPLSRRAEFERLLLKLCPTQQWIVLLIDYQQDFGVFGPTFDSTFH